MLIKYGHHTWKSTSLHWKMFKDAQQSLFHLWRISPTERLRALNLTTGVIQLSGDHITRGHSLKIKKIRPRLKLRRCSFPLRCTDHWNNLPTSVVEAISVASFERRLDKHWNNLPLKLHYLDDTTAARAHNVTLSDTDPDLTVEAWRPDVSRPSM